jgi:hypothetical protein
MIKTILALIFAILFGYSLTHLLIEIASLSWEIWAAITTASGIGLILCLYLSRAQQKKESSIDRFEKEFKLVLRSHMKVSILFWSHYYQKAKMKTFEEAKKEVFQDLKKEFPHIPWMESMLEEIRQELSKYR